MTTAEHLDTIDRLRAGEFPTGREGDPGHSAGPGHRLVLLGRTRDLWDDDGSGRDEEAEQIDAEYGALTQALTDRWGEPQVFAVGSLLDRAFAGEEIPQPWDEVSHTTDHVHLWRVGERWVVVYVARWEAEFPYLLMAGVTVVDPP
ncbi:hypothetical protein WDV06_31545 [Streptomyces racemochromogenes]|uniref:Uncharacterized protein n=1 Tax=Streptomyces racemochromogenes TaxID=67353 RepID=A0ABW7PMG0_9ACTN